MLVYIVIALLLSVLAGTYKYMDARSRQLSFWIVAFVFFFIAAFRGKDVDIDYVPCYQEFCDLTPLVTVMFDDFGRYFNALPHQEFSFCFLVSVIKFFTNNPMPIVALTYAFFAVPVKMIGIKRLANEEIFGLALLTYFTNLFFLHEMTQMRAGLASAIFIYSLTALCDGDRKKYVLLNLFAFLIHRSAICAIPFCLVNNKGMSFKLWFGLLFTIFAMALVNADPISVLLDYDVPILTYKLKEYLHYQKYTQFKMNPFNTFLMLQMLATICLYWKRKLIEPHCPSFYLLMKISVVSMMLFYFFIRIPVFAHRLNDYFACVQIILLPLLIYAFKPKSAAAAIVVCMLWGIMLVNLFYNHLLQPYYLVFFD
ncbi:MAG: EpsG family protein [Bacteroidales bacterium]|nr:EpsG family protein [Candidatus Physcocola equi]